MKLKSFFSTIATTTLLLSLFGCSSLNAVNDKKELEANQDAVSDAKKQEREVTEDKIEERVTTLFDSEEKEKPQVEIANDKPKNTSNGADSAVKKDSYKGEGTSPTTSHEGTWVRTKDGDTIVVAVGDKQETVRLLLIDTPESVKPNEKPQIYGKQASKFVKKLMEQNERITLEVGNPTHDKYNRLLAYVYLEDGTMLNELLVREGLARVAYIYPPNTQYLDVLKESEEQAKAEQKLIWSVDGYVTDKGFDMTVVSDKDILESIKYKP